MQSVLILIDSIYAGDRPVSACFLGDYDEHMPPFVTLMSAFIFLFCAESASHSSPLCWATTFCVSRDLAAVCVEEDGRRGIIQESVGGDKSSRPPSTDNPITQEAHRHPMLTPSNDFPPCPQLGPTPCPHTLAPPIAFLTLAALSASDLALSSWAVRALTCESKHNKVDRHYT